MESCDTNRILGTNLEQYVCIQKSIPTQQSVDVPLDAKVAEKLLKEEDKNTNKMRFLIIYSDGPTGSSSLASLLEKYGFINLPFRKFNLSQYVMGVKSLSDKTMQLKFLDRIDKLSVPARSGGVSVNDRNRRKEIIRTNKPTKKEIDEFLSFEPSNLESLISHCFLFTSKFIIYKNNIPSPKGFIIRNASIRIKHSFINMNI